MPEINTADKLNKKYLREEMWPTIFCNGCGHGVVSFLGDLSSRHREAVTNSFLLAQLAADKKTSKEEDLDQWYLAYFETLTKVGWIIQEKDFSEYSKSGTQ